VRGFGDARTEVADGSSGSGTFEPLLAGDRQRQNHVAKARNPLQRGALKSVSRELPGVALAAFAGRVYRLCVNRCVRVSEFSEAHSGRTKDVAKTLTEWT
jgi:hypothetical protein